MSEKNKDAPMQTSEIILDLLKIVAPLTSKISVLKKADEVIEFTINNISAHASEQLLAVIDKIIDGSKLSKAFLTIKIDQNLKDISSDNPTGLTISKLDSKEDKIYKVTNKTPGCITFLFNDLFIENRIKLINHIIESKKNDKLPRINEDKDTLKAEELTHVEDSYFGKGLKIKFSGSREIIELLREKYFQNGNRTKLNVEIVSLGEHKIHDQSGEISFFVKNKSAFSALNKFLDEECNCKVKNLDTVSPWIAGMIDKDTQQNSKGKIQSIH